MKVSVIIPVYNEESTIEEIIIRVKAQELASEIVIVDDGSLDGTQEILSGFAEDDQVQVILHDRNRGKGAAVRTGFQNATGEVFLINKENYMITPSRFFENTFLTQNIAYPEIKKPLASFQIEETSEHAEIEHAEIEHTEIKIYEKNS